MLKKTAVFQGIVFLLLFGYADRSFGYADPLALWPPGRIPVAVAPASRPSLAPSLLHEAPPGGVYDRQRKMCLLPTLVRPAARPPSVWAGIAAAFVTKQQASRALIIRSLWAILLVLGVGFLLVGISILAARPSSLQREKEEDARRLSLAALTTAICGLVADAGFSANVETIPYPSEGKTLVRLRGKPLALSVELDDHQTCRLSLLRYSPSCVRWEEIRSASCPHKAEEIARFFFSHLYESTP